MNDLTKNQIKEIVRMNLVKFRKEKGVTQSDVAAHLNITKTGVASWEQGRTSPDIETLFLLSKYYKKSIDSFYEVSSPKVTATVTHKIPDVKDLSRFRHHQIREEVPVRIKHGENEIVGFVDVEEILSNHDKLLRTIETENKQLRELVNSQKNKAGDQS